jgi:hypothetical protein
MPTKSSGFGGSNQMRALAMSAPGVPSFVPPAPAPVYQMPAPVRFAPAPAPSFTPPPMPMFRQTTNTIEEASGQGYGSGDHPPFPWQLQSGRPMMSGFDSTMLATLAEMQMGLMSRYLGQAQPPDTSTYLPGLFGGGQNTSGAAPMSPYQLPAPYPVSGNVPITYSSDIPYWEKGPKSQYFDPQAWTDY